jgi:hypothetical protein
MATSRALAGVIIAAAALAGCGGGRADHTSGGGTAGRTSGASSPVPTSGAAGTVRTSGGGGFGWFRPSPAPTGWPTAAIQAGAAIRYPPGWERIKSDPGTVSVAALARDHRFIGYLNLTPRQGAETINNWARFRVAHNADEHERHVTKLAAATGLRFGSARGSCIRDAYTTTTGARYIELACLVAGQRASVVVVGAAPPAAWSRTEPLLERAISSVTA